MESCTALVEHFDGRLAILYWAEQGSVPLLEAPAKSRPRASAPAGAKPLVEAL